jgi:hypothetical protein
MRRYPSFTFWFRVYVIAALVGAAVVAPLLLVLLPLALALGYAALWRWPLSRAAVLLTDYFVFFTLPLLFQATLGVWSLAVALPLLPLLLRDLEHVALRRRVPDDKLSRRLSGVTLTLLSTAIGAVLVSQIFSSLTLLLSGTLALLLLTVLLLFAWARMARLPITVSAHEQRILAGTREVYQAKLSVPGTPGGSLSLRSVEPWVRLRGGPYTLAAAEITLRIAVTPELAGPRDVVLRGVASDRWGLVLNRFEFVPLSLNVIPRARYAAWLARRFLAEAGSGDMHYVAEIPNTTARFVSAQGVEYFYSRAYQPGDSLNRIDWKHTAKYDGLITKNFVEMRGQQALMLVNLAAADDREADAVAYKTLMTALSLAREDIPALVAAYDRQGVKLVTGALASRRLVLQALRLVREMTVYTPPRRYLASPRVARLKANLKRLEGIPNPATTVLGELMRWEVDNLKRRTAESPVSEALRRVGVRRLSEYTVMLISGLNHDADAIAYQRYQLEGRGVSVINV